MVAGAWAAEPASPSVRNPDVVRNCGIATVQREHRLRRRDDFRRVLGSGRRVTSPEIVLYHHVGEATDVPRVGFVVPRRVGGAVVRNRVRRLLREATRPLLPHLVACDIVVVARPPVTGAGAEGLSKILSHAAARAGLLRT